MVVVFETLFPGLRTTVYRVTSPRTKDYNCIAWAAGDTLKWWWPTEDPFDEPPFWPPGVPREETLSAFVAALGTVGYGPAAGDASEPGFEKGALFADARGTPTHAARQLPNGRWTSKLGKSEDIEHDLYALEGDMYGAVAHVLKRPLPATAIA
jgi:hypothetical protein